MWGKRYKSGIVIVCMNKKIMALVYSEKGNFLLLRTNPKWMKCDVWFVVTGSIKKGEKEKEAVEREVEEETGLEILSIKETDYFCEYEWPKDSGKMHYEKAFLVKVKEKIPKLSGEHLEFKWLSKTDFLKKIDWEDERDELTRILGFV